MNQTEQALLNIIQISLFGKEISLPSDPDWEAILDEAEKQTILGFVIPAAPEEYRKKWSNKADRILFDFIRILHAQTQLVGLFKDNQIPMAVLKGSAAAVYYPNPSCRSMGDIDFIVPEKHFEEANRLMQANGFSFCGEHREHRHTSYLKDGISFELHHHFSYSDIDVESFIRDGFSNLKTGEINGNVFPMLPRLANGLVLLAHMIHHFKSGVGLRQAIDWMMYVNSIPDDTFWVSEFLPAASSVGLETTAAVATKMCQMHLGLSDRITWCRDADPDLCDELMQGILASGNFGIKKGEGSKIAAVLLKSKEKGAFRFLQEQGKKNWKACQKHPWLKPFAWLYQAGRYIRQGVRIRDSHAKKYDDIQQQYRKDKLYHLLNSKNPKS